MKIMEIVQRILDLVNDKAKSKRDFAALIGMEQVTFNNYMIGKRGLSYEVVDAILRTFPEVSAEWLLRGSGEMLKDTQSPPSAANSDTEPKFSTTSAMYETLIKDRDEQIEELKAEVNKLIGENNVMREQLGMKERKISSKSA